MKKPGSPKRAGLRVQFDATARNDVGEVVAVKSSDDTTRSHTRRTHLPTASDNALLPESRRRGTSQVASILSVLTTTPTTPGQSILSSLLSPLTSPDARSPSRPTTPTMATVLPVPIDLPDSTTLSQFNPEAFSALCASSICVATIDTLFTAQPINILHVLRLCPFQRPPDQIRSVMNLTSPEGWKVSESEETTGACVCRFEETKAAGATDKSAYAALLQTLWRRFVLRGTSATLRGAFVRLEEYLAWAPGKAYACLMRFLSLCSMGFGTLDIMPVAQSLAEEGKRFRPRKHFEVSLNHTRYAHPLCTDNNRPKPVISSQAIARVTVVACTPAEAVEQARDSLGWIVFRCICDTLAHWDNVPHAERERIMDYMTGFCPWAC